MKIRLLVLALSAALFLSLGWQQLDSNVVQAQTPTPLDEAQALLEDERNTVEVVERYGPSVVAINVEVGGQRIDPFSELPEEFRRFFEFLPRDFFGLPQTPQRGSGSGFVVDEAGRIVTNYHVVQAALQPGSIEMVEGAVVSVVFHGRPDDELAVRVVGANPSYDLALLELESPDDLPDGLTPIPFADSDAVRVGQKTIAIGNPFGLQSTVTTGIVSALGRDVPGVGQINIPMIQTDAAINPGNSGGPLLNSRGELIGINTAIVPGLGMVGQTGFIGVGFAVPSNLLAQSLTQLEEGYSDIFSTRPRIGITIQDIRDYPASARQNLRLPERGLMIVEVAEDGPADEVGLRAADFEVSFEGQSFPAGGDIITGIDGQPVESGQQLQDIVFGHQPGDIVELTIWREGEEMTVEVTLEVVPVN